MGFPVIIPTKCKALTYLLLNILTTHYQDAQLVTHCVTQKNSKHKGAIDICFWSFLSNATLTVEIDMDLNPRNTRIWIRIRQQQKPGMSLKKKESGSKSMVLQHNKIHAFFCSLDIMKNLMIKLPGYGSTALEPRELGNENYSHEEYY